MKYELVSTASGNFLVCRASRLCWRLTSHTPEREAALRAFGDELEPRQLAQVARGDYGPLARAPHRSVHRAREPKIGGSIGRCESS